MDQGQQYLPAGRSSLREIQTCLLVSTATPNLWAEAVADHFLRQNCHYYYVCLCCC
jgi:hypothetical protein